jgi:hypothetical protein
VTVSIHTTVILSTAWNCWPPDERELWRLALLVVNALAGLGMLGWSLLCLRQEKAMDRQWKLQSARWHAESHFTQESYNAPQTLDHCISADQGRWESIHR